MTISGSATGGNVDAPRVWGEAVIVEKRVHEEWRRFRGALRAIVACTARNENGDEIDVATLKKIARRALDPKGEALQERS